MAKNGMNNPKKDKKEKKTRSKKEKKPPDREMFFLKRTRFFPFPFLQIMTSAHLSRQRHQYYWRVWGKVVTKFTAQLTSGSPQ